MQLAMDAVNEANRRDGLPELEMGIGVNTGEVVVGNIGSDTRAKYGVVGNSVNLTSRIESYTVGGQVLISDATRLEVGDSLQVGVPLRFAVLQSKHLDDASLPGTLAGLSSIGGEVLCDRPLAPPSDIKVELLPPSFSIRFTSVPPDLTRWLSRLLEPSK